MDSNDEERSIASESSDESYGDPFDHVHYHELMERLRTNNCPYLEVNNWHVLDIIFANIDEFCDAVSSSEGIKSVWLGDGGWEDAHGPKLEITEENVSHWNKLLQTLGTIGSVEELVFGGYVHGSLMIRLVEALQQVFDIQVHLPWRTLDGEDLRPFVEYLAHHPSKAVVLRCIPTFDNDYEQRGVLDGTMNHFLAGHGAVAQLFRLESVEYLSLRDIQFTADECKVLGNILSSEECKIEDMTITGCSFLDGGEQQVCNALASIKSLESVILEDLFQDKVFCDKLIACLPLNRLIDNVSLVGSTPLSDVANVDIVGLIKNISSRNKAVVEIGFVGECFTLDESDIQELQQELQQNYTLKSIRVGEKEPFQTITRLNKAGRRYLSEDSISNSKCIAVLAKVKNDLDCLYYHLRENPILCVSFCKNGSEALSGSKRKVVPQTATERKSIGG